MTQSDVPSTCAVPQRHRSSRARNAPARALHLAVSSVYDGKIITIPFTNLQLYLYHRMDIFARWAQREEQHWRRWRAFALAAAKA